MDFPGGPVVKNVPGNAGDTPCGSGAAKPVYFNYWGLRPRAHSEEEEIMSHSIKSATELR